MAAIANKRSLTDKIRAAPCSIEEFCKPVSAFKLRLLFCCREEVMAKKDPKSTKKTSEASGKPGRPFSPFSGRQVAHAVLAAVATC